MTHRFKKGDFFRIVTWPKGDERAPETEKEYLKKIGEELKGKILQVQSARAPRWLYPSIQVISFFHPDKAGQEYYQICSDFVEWVPKREVKQVMSD